MKKFTFNLQSVLDHRLLLEEREQEKLLRIQQETALAESDRQQRCDEIDELRCQMAQPEPGEVYVDQILRIACYVRKLEDDVAALSRRIDELAREKVVQSEVLLTARRNREVLENLKAKSLEQHQREANVMEQKMLDELTAVKFSPHDEQNLPARRP